MKHALNGGKPDRPGQARALLLLLLFVRNKCRVLLYALLFCFSGTRARNTMKSTYPLFEYFLHRRRVRVDQPESGYVRAAVFEFVQIDRVQVL